MPSTIAMSNWRPGAKVRTKPTVRPRRYADRRGTVAELREVGQGVVEVGVKVGGRVSWFDPGELEQP